MAERKHKACRVVAIGGSKGIYRVLNQVLCFVQLQVGEVQLGGNIFYPGGFDGEIVSRGFDEVEGDGGLVVEGWQHVG